MALTTVDTDLDTSAITFFPNTVRGTVVFTPRGSPSNKPKVIHIENAMATADGVRSLNKNAYIGIAPPNLPQPFQSRKLMFIQSVTGETGRYFSTNAGGATRFHYVWDVDNQLWRTPASVSDAASVRLITQAFVNGISYGFNSNEGLYTFATNFASLNIQTVQGITVGLINGCTNALNYLVMWDDNTIYWSAPNTPLDFRPIVATITTGAGSARPQDLVGLIYQVHPIANGFLIYTSTEIIAARYSGNSINPWIFKKVSGSDGIAEVQEAVAIGGSLAAHFAYTKSGFQEVTLTAGNQVLPALSDFMASLWGTVSNNDGTFTETQITGTGKLVSMTYVSNRYLCVSYSGTGFASPTLFQGIWIFDVLLKQFGHIVVSHLSTFDFFDPLTDNDDRVGMLGVWLADGKVDNYRLSAQGRNSTGDVALTGEIIFADFTLSSGFKCSVNMATLQGNIEANYAATVGIRTRTEEGQQAAEGSFTRFPANMNTYVGDQTGVAHRVRVSGNFDMNSVTLDAVQRGRG